MLSYPGISMKEAKLYFMEFKAFKASQFHKTL